MNYGQLAAKVYDDWHGVTEGFEWRVDRFGGKAIVSIAGTKDAKDLLIDARFIPRYEDGLGFVSGGCLDVARDMAVAWGRVLDDEPIVTNGHSAGGAIALLAGAHLYTNGYDVREIWTHGAPRVGRLKVLDDVPHFRRIHGNDLVTFLGLRGSSGAKIPFGYPSKWYPNVKDHRVSNYT